jgi:hypothetical protein
LHSRSASQLESTVPAYAFFDGPSAFEVLAHRMDAKAGLQVTLLQW